MSAVRPQHLVALDEANAVHIGRAAVKRKVRAGQMSVVEAMAMPCCASMRLYDLLMAQYRFGEVKANAFFRDLAHAGTLVGPMRTVKDLTARQRAAVVALLETKAREAA